MCRIPWVTGQCFEHVASLLGMRQEGTGTELSEGGAEGLACARWGSCRRGLPVKSLVHLEHTWSLHSPPFCVHIILSKNSHKSLSTVWCSVYSIIYYCTPPQGLAHSFGKDQAFITELFLFCFPPSLPSGRQEIPRSEWRWEKLSN